MGVLLIIAIPILIWVVSCQVRTIMKPTHPMPKAAAVGQ